MDWLHRLDDLLNGRHTTTGDELDAGAELIVYDPNGGEEFRAALARHHRLDHDVPNSIWIRPIFGCYVDRNGVPEFNLSLTRRRYLSCVNVHLDGEAVVFRLGSGQTAIIQPASGEQLAQLQQWDTFYYTSLTDDERVTLQELAEDSWHGRFA